MTRLLALVAAIAACLLLPASAFADPHDARTAFWRLNEASGPAIDSVGGHDGTYVGTPQRGVAGGTADGDLAVRLNNGDNDDRVTTTYNPFANGAVRTFEGWAKRDNTDTYDMIFSGSGSRAPVFYLQQGSTNAKFWPDSGVGSSLSWSGMPTGVWFHWVLVFDEPGDRAELFVDGVSKGAQTMTTPYNASPGTFTLGYTTVDNPFTGSLDDVAVYDRGLTATEVGQLEIPDMDDARTAFWRLNDPSGPAIDSVGGHNGTYVGTPERGVDGATADGDDAVRLNNGDGDDRVTTSYNPFANGAVRSFEGWAKRDSTSTYDMIFSGSGARAPVFYLQQGSTNARFWPDSGVSSSLTWSGMPTGEWFHWVVVFDEPRDTVELFVNGVSRGVQTTTTPYNASPGTFTLGYTTVDNPFGGSLDDVAVYSRGLSPTEVGQLYIPEYTAARTALWRLNETSGPAIDSVGGHNGTYVGTPQRGVAGATRDGDAAVRLNNGDGDDRVTTSYNPFANGAARSFEGWAKRDSTSTYDMIFSGSGSRAPVFYLQQGSTNARFWPDTGVSSSLSWPGMPTGAWFHWVLVFDEPNDTAELFVNGVSKGTQTTTTPYNASPGTFTLGYTAVENPFGGSLDDVAVYDRALAAEEVAELAVPVSFRDSFDGPTFPQEFDYAAWCPGGDCLPSQYPNGKLLDGTGGHIDHVTPSGFSATDGTKVMEAGLTPSSTRAEIQCHRTAAYGPNNNCAVGEGGEAIYEFDIRIPSGTTLPGRESVVWQTKPTSPNGLSDCYGGGLSMKGTSDPSKVELFFLTRRGAVSYVDNYCTSPGTMDSLGVFSRDAWHRFRLHARWSVDPNVGFVQVMVDGKERLPLQSVSNMLDGAGRVQMMRIGTYESLNASHYQATYNVFYDNFLIRQL